VLIPSVRHMFRLLSVFPWVFVGTLGLMIVMEFGGEYPSWTTIAQIGYVGLVRLSPALSICR